MARSSATTRRRATPVPADRDLTPRPERSDAPVGVDDDLARPADSRGPAAGRRARGAGRTARAPRALHRLVEPGPGDAPGHLAVARGRVPGQAPLPRPRGVDRAVPVHPRLLHRRAGVVLGVRARPGEGPVRRLRHPVPPADRCVHVDRVDADADPPCGGARLGLLRPVRDPARRTGAGARRHDDPARLPAPPVGRHDAGALAGPADAGVHQLGPARRGAARRRHGAVGSAQPAVGGVLARPCRRREAYPALLLVVLLLLCLRAGKMRPWWTTTAAALATWAAVSIPMALIAPSGFAAFLRQNAVARAGLGLLVAAAVPAVRLVAGGGPDQRPRRRRQCAGPRGGRDPGAPGRRSGHGCRR